MMVKRWECKDDGVCGSAPDGPCVEYTDYAALEAKVRELEANNERLREAMTPSTETKIAYWGSDELPVMDWGHIKMLMQAMLNRATSTQETDNG